jgi:hypothetical protein
MLRGEPDALALRPFRHRGRKSRQAQPDLPTRISVGGFFQNPLGRHSSYVPASMPHDAAASVSVITDEYDVLFNRFEWGSSADCDLSANSAGFGETRLHWVGLYRLKRVPGQNEWHAIQWPRRSTCFAGSRTDWHCDCFVTVGANRVRHSLTYTTAFTQTVCRTSPRAQSRSISRSGGDGVPE